MSDDTEDFFVPDGPERDRYGRPLLLPRGSDERKPYTRASSLADYLEDFAHLHTWEMRYLARELGRHRDLALLAAAEPYTTGFDRGDLKENRASGRRLDEIIERCLDRGKIHEKADYGTTVHARTEPGNDGDTSWDPTVNNDVRSYWECLSEIGAAIIGTELFTANDDLMVAGTFDNLKYIPGYGICITDKKTSSEVHGNTFRIQLASYATADLYDWETDQRMTLEEYVDSQGWDPGDINRHDGFIFWIKNGQTKVYKLDLSAGLEAARTAVWVRDNHRRGTHKWLVDKELRQSAERLRQALADQVESAAPAELETLWRKNRHLWTPEHTALAKQRKEGAA